MSPPIHSLLRAFFPAWQIDNFRTIIPIHYMSDVKIFPFFLILKRKFTVCPPKLWMLPTPLLQISLLKDSEGILLTIKYVVRNCTGKTSLKASFTKHSFRLGKSHDNRFLDRVDKKWNDRVKSHRNCPTVLFCGLELV